jgi:CRP-like cAMP-binding protein
MTRDQTARDPTSNRLISLLPNGDRRQLLARCERIALERRDPLSHAGVPMNAVYFPLGAVLSMTALLADGREVEIATVGIEGMLGHPVYLGVDAAPMNAFAQVEGEVLRMTASAFHEEVAASRNLRGILDRYLQALFVQISQNTVCNSAHLVPQRCARWLLMTQDRVGKAGFGLTQEFMALMLGVRRASVTVAARDLQDRGLIEYRRGHLRIAAREGLEEVACECYDIVNKEYARLLG